jgi:callose synthase
MLIQALSGVDASLKKDAEILQNSSLEAALNTQFLIQIGIFTAVPMIVNLILEEGILKVCSIHVVPLVFFR